MIVLTSTRQEYTVWYMSDVPSQLPSTNELLREALKQAEELATLLAQREKHVH